MLQIEISPLGLSQLRNSSSDTDQPLILIDCREQEEYDLVHLEGAVLLPLSEMLHRQEELQAWKDRQVVVYCHLGMRSLNAVDWMRQQGLSRAQSLRGGIDAWAEQIEPDMRRY